MTATRPSAVPGQSAAPAPSTELWTENSRYPREKSATRFTLVRPKPLASYATIILVPDAAGMTPFARHLAQRLAHEGFLAFAVDLFSRFGVARPEDAAAGEALLRSVPDRQWVNELEHGARYLVRRADVNLGRIAALGIGAGGHYAYQWALQSSELNALVCVQSPHLVASATDEPMRAPLATVAHVQVPLLTLWGERDPGLAAGSIERLGEALEKHHQAYHLKTYPNAHGNLLDAQGASFDRAVADDCWSLIIRFLGERASQKAGTA